MSHKLEDDNYRVRPVFGGWWLVESVSVRREFVSGIWFDNVKHYTKVAKFKDMHDAAKFCGWNCT